MLAISIANQPVTANSANTNTAISQYDKKGKSDNQDKDKYLGYSVDGRTSASVLAAQRSHTVAGEDERDFAVFTGIVVIFIVIFFSQIDFLNK